MTQALRVLEAFERHDCFAVIQDFPTVHNIQLKGFRKTYQLPLWLQYSWPAGVILTLIWNSFLLFGILLKERPKVLFSTGAEIAIPAFYLAKVLFRTKLIFLESLTRIEKPSLTGKWLYPITDLFLVQEPDLLPFYGPKAVFQGNLL